VKTSAPDGNLTTSIFAWPSSTPKALYLKAQGRAAHPGERGEGTLFTPKGFHQEHPMPQSLAQIYLHIVFSTKNRQPFLLDQTIRDEMHQYLGGACNNLDSPVLRVGGVADHVHILCRLGKTIAVADLVKELKRESSKWIKTKSPTMADFYWQSGYGAFSVSPGHVEALRTYIANQEEHHRKASFQEEFRRLLTKYGLQWDERYVWD
jgi:putative transposase